MRLSFSSIHFRDNLNIDDNIKFVIQIKTHFVKINDKTKINIFEKIIFYRFINQFSKISLILKSNDEDIQFNVMFYLAYLTLKYIL